MTARVVKLANRSPLAALERLPGWWLGAASTRLKFARDALDLGLERLADEHLQAATDYEKRAAKAASTA